MHSLCVLVRIGPVHTFWLQSSKDGPHIIYLGCSHGRTGILEVKRYMTTQTIDLVTSWMCLGSRHSQSMDSMRVGETMSSLLRKNQSSFTQCTGIDNAPRVRQDIQAKNGCAKHHQTPLLMCMDGMQFFRASAALIFCIQQIRLTRISTWFWGTKKHSFGSAASNPNLLALILFLGFDLTSEFWGTYVAVRAGKPDLITAGKWIC